MGFVDDLENSIDIVELVGRYAKLKKAGVNYKALCPFPGHSEKTPSFVVSPAKQIGYCFGCHKGGGPVKFIMDMENCEFREAVQILGSVTGQEIKGFTENKEKIEIKKNLYSLYRDAVQYYKQALDKNPEVKKYLFDRGLTQDDINTFHFGYADNGIELYNYLKGKDYDSELIEQSQIFLNVSAKKDKFIGRVIFPIQNLRGDFVAFAGRIIGKGEPKYLNSPASAIYDKSSILYGLYSARSSVTKYDHIIITEGYMDTIALHKAGYLQTVAVSGTALTEKHITIIKRLTHKIYLCFDNDKAGEQATKSSLEILKNQGLEVKIIELTGAKDPDEYLESGENFQTLIDRALSPIAYLIQKNNYNLSSLDEKKKFLDEILTLLKTYNDAIEQDMYLKEIAKISDTPLEVLYETFKQIKKTRERKRDILNSEENSEKKSLSSEDLALAYMFENPENISKINDGIIFENLESNILSKAYGDFTQFELSLDLEKKERYKALAFQIASRELSDSDYADNLKKLIQKLNSDIYKSQISHLKAGMQAGDTKAFEKYSQLLNLAKEHNIK